MNTVSVKKKHAWLSNQRINLQEHEEKISGWHLDFHIKDYLASSIALKKLWIKKLFQDRNKVKTNNGDPQEFELEITLKC